MYFYLWNLILYITPQLLFTYLISEDDIKYQALDYHLTDVLSRLTREYLKETDVGDDDYDDYYDNYTYPYQCRIYMCGFNIYTIKFQFCFLKMHKICS